MKGIVGIVALCLALGWTLVGVDGGFAEPGGLGGQTQALTQQWQKAFQSLLNILPGAPGSNVPSSGSSAQYGAPAAPTSGRGGGSQGRRPSPSYGAGSSGGSGGESVGAPDAVIQKAISYLSGEIPSSASGGSSGGGGYSGGSSSSGGGAAYSSYEDETASSGSDKLLPEIVNLLEQGGGSSGSSGGGGQGYSGGGGQESRGYGSPFSDDSSQAGDTSGGGYANSNTGSGLSGGYTGSSSSGSVSPSSQYGAPSDQTSPSGYSQSEPQYGVPDVASHIPQGEYGAPEQGQGHQGQNQGGYSSSPASGGYPVSSSSGSGSPSPQYGAPPGQTAPSGYSQSEPQYGVPDAGSHIPQGEYAAPSQGQSHQGQDQGGYSSAPATGGYPGSGQDGGGPGGSSGLSGLSGGPGQFQPGFDIGQRGGSGGGGNGNGAGGGHANFPQPPQHIFVDAVASLPDIVGNSPPQTQPQVEAEHHNIIFVKAPMPPQFETRVILPPPDQQNTKVYVLTKDVDENEMQNNIRFVTPRPTPPPKPEVFFVRYAANANPNQAMSPFNRAMDQIPPLPQNFDVYAPQMTHSGYNLRKREVSISMSSPTPTNKPKTIYTLRIHKPSREVLETVE